MSSNRILSEDAGRDPDCDSGIGSASSSSSNELAGRNHWSLVNKGDLLTASTTGTSIEDGGVMDSQSETGTTNTSTAIGSSNLSTSLSRDSDSNQETTVAQTVPLPVVGQGTVTTPSPGQSFCPNPTEANPNINTNTNTEKESITNIHEDAGQDLATTPTVTMTNSRYPPPLFCPLTRRLFQDPVVAPDGHTYERDVLLQRSQQEYLTQERLYPNRALQEILDEEPRHPFLEQLWEHSLWPPDRPLPDAYYCPITFELMHVPVIDPEGNTYEKAAIVHWLRVNGHSPISRSSLHVTQLYPNHVIRELLEYHANDKPNHPALSKWKSEPPPSVPEPSDIPVYPSTFAELEAHHAHMRRQRHKVIACTILGVICLILAIIGAASYGGYCIFISIWLGCCVRDSCRRLRELRYEHNQERLSLEEAQNRVEALHERLRQLQQEEAQEDLRLSTVGGGGGVGGGVEQFHSVEDVPLGQQGMLQRVEALHEQYVRQQEPALPMPGRAEQSIQDRDNATLDQQETQPPMDAIQDPSRQQQEPAAPRTRCEEHIFPRQDEEQEQEIDLEEGNMLPTASTLQDPSSVQLAVESTRFNYGPVAVSAGNLSEPRLEGSFPVEDEDIELGPVDISLPVGPPTTTGASGLPERSDNTLQNF